MSSETDISRDTNSSPTRFLMDCEGFNLNLDNPYGPFDANYKFFNPGTSRPDSVPLDSGSKTPMSMISMFSQQHPWSIMMFDGAYAPSRSTSTSPSSISSDLPPSVSSPLNSFHSQMPSTNSDRFTPQSAPSRTRTHDYSPVFDNHIPSGKPRLSNGSLPSLEPDSPTPGSLVSSDNLMQGAAINQALHGDFCLQVGSQGNIEHKHQEMRDQIKSNMVSTSNARNPLSLSESNSTKARPTRTSTRSAAMATDSGSPSKSTLKAKKSTGSKNTSASRKAKSTPNNSSKSSSKSSQSRKHLAEEEESPEAKRQKFLERNRMAATKCREKKRLQTLQTIAEADEIKERNQSLHASLDELMEEVRVLKNQILCHNNCGCDVIQKFVQSRYGPSSFITGRNHMH
ncbi:hypothetical protein BGX27_007374 [Mortierella sp. AM989]|nr:hypothetical protein BGX27_007374 [Mortierella sp. AM989]